MTYHKPHRLMSHNLKAQSISVESTIQVKLKTESNLEISQFQRNNLYRNRLCLKYRMLPRVNLTKSLQSSDLRVMVESKLLQILETVVMLKIQGNLQIQLMRQIAMKLKIIKSRINHLLVIKAKAMPLNLACQEILKRNLSLNKLIVLVHQLKQVMFMCSDNTVLMGKTITIMISKNIAVPMVAQKTSMKYTYHLIQLGQLVPVISYILQIKRHLKARDIALDNMNSNYMIQSILCLTKV